MTHPYEVKSFIKGNFDGNVCYGGATKECKCVSKNYWVRVLFEDYPFGLLENVILDILSTLRSCGEWWLRAVKWSKSTYVCILVLWTYDTCVISL